MFAVVVAALLGFSEQPGRADLFVYLAAILLMVLVGVVGVVLYIERNLTTRDVLATERFLRRAPIMLSDIGTIELLVSMDLRELPYRDSEHQTAG